MSYDTVQAVFHQVFGSGWCAEELEVVWHAGEPLALPIEYYRTAFSLIESITPPNVSVRHAFQTNGMLIDDDWCGFFLATGARIGLSIDGPKELNDRNRLSRAGNSTHTASMLGADRLQRHGVPFQVISVLSAQSLDYPAELYRFFEDAGITDVSFNVEETEGGHVSSLESRHESRYKRFLIEFWALLVERRSIHYVREFDSMLRAVIAPPGRVADNLLVTPFAILNVDWQGNYSTFSPETLGVQNERYANFVIGNLTRDDLADGLTRDTFLKMNADVSAGVEKCRATCDYFTVCGGGAPANKLFENATFDSTSTRYCRFHIQLLADVVTEMMV